jgi:hypothetical protein
MADEPCLSLAEMPLVKQAVERAWPPIHPAMRQKLAINRPHMMQPPWLDLDQVVKPHGRLGVSLGALHAGPEVSFLGDKGYDAYKVGAFLGGIQLGQSSSLTVNAGYMDTDGNASSDGGYLGASMSFKF